MNLDKLKNGLVFDKELNVIGEIKTIDLENEALILDIGEEEVLSYMKNATFLEELGAIGDYTVYSHDVVATKDGKLFEIVPSGAKDVQLRVINEKLEVIDNGEILARTDLHTLANYVEFVGSIFELEPEEEDLFNVVIVRDMTGGDFQGYMYACNLPEVGYVDLVNLLFAGHEILEEKYVRKTVTIERFNEMIEKGELKIVELNEVLNYLTGMEEFANDNGTLKVAPVEEPVEEDFEEEVDEDICDLCGETIEDCDCEW
jgi:hypothetical protein